MSDAPACPICSLEDLLDGGDYHECNTCGHEFAKDARSEQHDVVDANGNVLANGDTVTLIKDVKINGGKSGRLKAGTKIKNIRLLDGKTDHEIDCKIEGRAMLVTAEFVKLA